MARTNIEGPYGPGNCYWRPPVNDWEARMGIEQLSPQEPDEILITEEEKDEFSTVPDERKPQYLIWKRMHWRINNYPLSKNEDY